MLYSRLVRDLLRKDNEFDYMGLYVIILTTSQHHDVLQRILNVFWQLYILNVMVVKQRINSEAYISYTYFPYTKQHCAKVVPIVFNYVNSEMSNDSIVFPNKLKNLNNCPITVATYNTTPHMVLRPIQDGTWYADGVDGNLLRFIAQRLNFSVIIKVPADGMAKGEFYLSDM